VFALRCTATGEAWAGWSPNLEAARNAELFQAGLGSHMNKDLQAVWNRHGEAAFQFEVLAVVDQDAAEVSRRNTLKTRKAHWVARFGAHRLSSR
jgi:hypothetical protein